MERVLFGVAFGQVLAVVLLVVLELLVVVAFWYLAELLWRGLLQGLRAALAPFGRFSTRGGYAHAE